MKDFLNKELEIGDKVVFITPNYREFSTGVIFGFTPMNVRVTIDRTQDSILQSPSQLIKL